MSKINRNTGNLLTCILEILIGILLLVDPVGFTSGIIIIFGIVLVVGGIISTFGYFRADAETASQGNGLVKGILFVMLGLFCITKSEWFLVTFPVLTVFYGILTLVSGVSKVQWAVDMLRTRQKYWFVEVIGAVLTIVCAVLILTNPFASTDVLWTFIGITMIAEAVVDVAAFVLGRK
ncbi:hypothetical protein BRYFOR_07271 [Marvinbryantia formatexigens DSM 14469]|uniref:Acid-resistance membrane protein n=1 Tax=Marvinbryantia formatexigens DSM 14469 TaxID=478749 RepID=C6LF69_9FIRM|nr:DUF308 domain-containing protein [Marvinbryantia formatexigens]EET60808.1 hypothetical protein BRYFOR_07271 [Marvinbryantia formatexigens DSM 14469]UWO26856.1 DUF308 domain-containing protein [Marvinbryantia formatexigens DSM 14469]SDG32112.1 Uncharacterized membrane protein HdeD, DUF308 family [Marvinbryantia formatexigens]